MRLCALKLLGLALIGQLALAAVALAVDQTEIKIEGRWSVVGVISGEANASGKATGIAVLRSNVTKKTYTLTVGDSVPNEFGFILKSVKAHSVEIASASSGPIVLTFSDALPETAEPVAETPSRSSRFLESYYRGFNHSRSDRRSVDDDDDDGLYLPPAPTSLGTPRVSITHDESIAAPATRPRTYRMDEQEDGFSVDFSEDEDSSARPND